MSILAIDAGTTGVTALVIEPDGSVSGRGYQEFRQHYPQPGWVEHRAEEIWQATLSACSAATFMASERGVAGATLAASAAGAGQISCIGLTNQRETAVLWDRRTLTAPRPAIVWQDRRSTPICEELRAAGHEPRVTELTGLRLDPYFTGTKLTWLATTEPELWAGVLDGSLAVGTVDSYLIARMTAGRRHVTDASNASRTLLFDIGAGRWSAELCELLRVPPAALPEVVPSWGVAGHADPAAFLGLSAPIAGIAGDQQAALFGQACFAEGDTKATYGTGSFVLVNTGSVAMAPGASLLSTVAWMSPDGDVTYALEGSVFVTGAAVQWLRDGLGLLDDAAQSEALAGSVPDSGGLVFVPALTGLGAPDWDPDARGAIFGITRGTTRAHLVRATLEAIAFEVRDVCQVMADESDCALRVLKADGGASGNDLLMQLQADQLQLPVERPVIAETTALGAGYLAGLATGVWSSPAEIEAVWRLGRRFSPGGRDEAGYLRWRAAVGRSKGWASVGR
ncbi:MAG TPA: glycerol kinase [Streptosporangiaceae bacterium]